VARDSVTEGARVTSKSNKHLYNALSLSLSLREIQLPPGGSLPLLAVLLNEKKHLLNHRLLYSIKNSHVRNAAVKTSFN
jgi:hypothetical protein